VTHEDAHALIARSDPLAWSADGRSILYSRDLVNDDLDVYTIEPDGSRLRQLTSNAVHDYAPAFSPDGRWIAFVRAAENSYELKLFVMAADGSAVRQLTRTGSNIAPAWSPDGSLILFVRGQRNPQGDEVGRLLYTIHPDGTHLRRVKTPDGVYDDPSWSPDGRAIAVTRNSVVEQSQLLLRVGADGSGARSLVDLGGDQAFTPEWAPDGRLISFVRESPASPPCRDCPDTVDIWTVRPSGSEAHMLAQSAKDAAWSPDGRHLVVQGENLRIVSTSGATEVTLGLRTDLRLAWFISAARLSWQTRCTVEGDGRGNRLRGGSGNDVVCGLGGADTITGGRGRDRLFGEEGNDTIVSRDRAFDIVGCGSGHDTAVADRIDLVGVDCERVERR
jgi:dipeptidyl aminopeptidase/acylaminoacyl peptidase